MSYQPNFSDPRVQRRIQRAIGFASGVMSTTKPNAWSTRYIDRWFGVQSNPLSRYLRQQLLITTDDHWNKDTGKCKEYLLNQSGVDFLLAQLDQHNTQLYPIVLQVAQQEYHTELATGLFAYNDQSQRLWHPLQNFRRDVKTQVLESAGYRFHYDIECCAFNLIHQYSQRIPEIVINQKWQQGPMDLYLFALREYITHRTRIREEIAEAADVAPDTIKRMINALLAGARLSTNPTTEIYQLFTGDHARIKFLQQHEYLTQLRADIKTCWDYIKPTMPRRSRTQSSGQERMIPISSRQKWGVYFDLERQVLNEIREFLCECDNKHFLEHDGWSCEHEIDQTSLSQRIQERTGFRVNFELTSLQHTTIPYCLTSPKGEQKCV
jgi:hypothetical protein